MDQWFLAVTNGDSVEEVVVVEAVNWEVDEELVGCGGGAHFVLVLMKGFSEGLGLGTGGHAGGLVCS